MVWWGWLGSRDGVRGATGRGFVSVPWLCTIWSVASLTLKKQTPGVGSGSQAAVSSEESGVSSDGLSGKAVAEGTGLAHPRLHPLPGPGPLGTLPPLHTLPLAPNGASVYLSCFSLLIPVL